MKKTLFTVLSLAASLLLFSCCQSCSQKDAPVDVVEPDDGKPKAGEYTFTVSHKNLLLVKGAVPGPKKALVTIKETVKVEC